MHVARLRSSPPGGARWRAGNRSTGVSLSSLVIDQTAPSAGTTINLLNADDTGVSATDNIIRYGTNFSIGNTSGLASDAVQVGVYDVFNSIETLLGYASINASRLWNFTYTGTALADGPHSLGIKTTDAAGNTSALSTTRLTLIVDSSPSTVLTGSLTSVTAFGAFAG
ncbi:MAG: hypothetical protein EBS89_13770, partial [Proteobacteria bacterium]|nr:hypothetical protein [Pseudomonadota bacterium]